MKARRPRPGQERESPRGTRSLLESASSLSDANRWALLPEEDYREDFQPGVEGTVGWEAAEEEHTPQPRACMSVRASQEDLGAYRLAHRGGKVELDAARV